MKRDSYEVKRDSHEAFIREILPRTVTPAEACSEFGWVADERKRAQWVARALAAAKRWAARHRRRAGHEFGTKEQHYGNH